MLLYVDKKKQKRQRIKIFCLVFGSLLLLLINILHFAAALHHSDKSLTSYKPLDIHKSNPAETSTITIFTAESRATPEIIIIPHQLNRTSALTAALAFSKIAPQTPYISFAPEIKDVDFLFSLAQIFIPDIQIGNKPDSILITTDTTDIARLIHEKMLYPRALNNRQSSKLSPNAQLDNLVNHYFPIPSQPQERMEKERLALAQFASDYKRELQNLVISETPTISHAASFPAQNILLQNASLCLKSSNTLACSLSSENSLEKNISLAKQKLPPALYPQQLFLLTSMAEITAASDLSADEGLLFRYGQREAVLIPNTTPGHNNNAIFRELKLQAGLNPDYQNEAMKFYKFKTVEINL